MIKVLFYTYFNNIYSSCKIEFALSISLQVQYNEGTKIESASNRYTFVWCGSVKKNKVKLETKNQNVLTEIDSQIKQDQIKLTNEQCFINLEAKEKVA